MAEWLCAENAKMRTALRLADGRTRKMTDTTRERRTTGVWLLGLRRERLNAGLTLKGLEERTAERAETRVYKATISEVERLVRGAHPRTAYALAQALGIKVEDLTSGE